MWLHICVCVYVLASAATAAVVVDFCVVSLETLRRRSPAEIRYFLDFKLRNAMKIKPYTKKTYLRFRNFCAFTCSLAPSLFRSPSSLLLVCAFGLVSFYFLAFSFPLFSLRISAAFFFALLGSGLPLLYIYCCWLHAKMRRNNLFILCLTSQSRRPSSVVCPLPLFTSFHLSLPLHFFAFSLQT